MIRRAMTLQWAFALISSAGPVLGAGTPVPAPMLGTCARGSCASTGDRLTITSSTVRFGAGKAERIVYRPADRGPGRGAIPWSDERDVSALVFVPSRNAIVEFPQGYGMPGSVLYRRCPTTHDRSASIGSSREARRAG